MGVMRQITDDVVHRIAEKADVSDQTVDRYLNPQRTMKPRTQKRIERAIRALHWYDLLRRETTARTGTDG